MYISKARELSESDGYLFSDYLIKLGQTNHLPAANYVVNNSRSKLQLKYFVTLQTAVQFFGGFFWDDRADCSSFLARVTQIRGLEVISLLYRLLHNITMETESALCGSS